MTNEKLLSAWIVKNNYSDLGQVGNTNLLELISLARAEERKLCIGMAYIMSDSKGIYIAEAIESLPEDKEQGNDLPESSDEDEQRLLDEQDAKDFY